MAQQSPIEWTDHTFNPWWGCVKVSAGCVNCYAEVWANRYGHDVWGVNKNRRFFSKRHWSQPIKWNQRAQLAGTRERVFCASMADVFEENDLLEDERRRLWKRIEDTPMLDWLLLTKRPENMVDYAPWKIQWPDNVWAMTSVENQDEAIKRVGVLAEVPAQVRGLSVEPLLGPVDLSIWIDKIDWVIVGGESGTQSRPMNIDWVRDLRSQCIESKTAFFFKQWGNWVPEQDSTKMKRVSKKDAGRMLDGQEWNQLPVRNLLIST